VDTLYLVPTLAGQDQQPDDIAKWPNIFARQPNGPQFLIAQYMIARPFTPARFDHRGWVRWRHPFATRPTEKPG
jgi:hypothetical protein